MAQQLTPLQIAELKEVFNVFDKDGDGHISPGELKEVMHDMNVTHVPDSEIREMLAQIDGDQNDTVDFAEWLQFIAMQFLNLQTSDEVVREAFQLLDPNDRGYIQTEDCRRMLELQGDEVTLREAEEVMREADLDRDGHINYEEFKAILVSR